MMKRLRLLVGGMVFLAGVLSRAETAPEWPDAPAVILREDIFGIRFRLAREDKGAKGAERFLREAMARGMTSEVKAYVAWVSLWSEAWGLPPILEPPACEALLRSAVEEGSGLAADVLGRAMIYGQGSISRDVPQGMKLLDLAVQRGCARALARRGLFRITGFGGPPDVLRGALEVREAAAKGSAIGLIDLAAGFESGQIGGAPNLTLALEHYYLLALENENTGWKKLEEFEQKGVPGARFMRALAYVRFANEGGFIAPSVVSRKLAVLEEEQSDSRAWVELGVARLFGVDWIKRNPALAKDYFTRAELAGNPEAKFFLAYMRLRGLAGPQETEAALAEMTALADAGDPRACARLGYYYYWGASEAGKLKKDPAKALHYSRRGAELGSKHAALNLAHHYKHGIGTAENPVLAAKLYWIAKEYGVYGAKEDLVRQLAFARVR